MVRLNQAKLGLIFGFYLLDLNGMAKKRKKQSQGNIVAWIVAIALVIILIMIAKLL